MSDASVDSLAREQQDAYAISAEFYDVVQAARDGTRVHQLYGGDVGNARLGVLDVGAARLPLSQLWASPSIFAA